MNHSTGQAAKILKLSVPTLRYYDDIGLTPFVMRNYNGSRIYTDTDIEWIYMIKCLRDIDMPIQKIKDYIELLLHGDNTVFERRDLMQSYKEYIDQKLKLLQLTQEMVNKKLEYYNKACDKSNNNLSISTKCSDYKESWESFKKKMEDNYHE